MVEVNSIKKVKGEIKIPGDKSITHRGVILSAIAEGESKILNPNIGDDTQRTLKIMEEIGARFTFENDGIRVKGIGIKNVKEPEDILYAGNSGTTIRLLSGLFSSIENKFFVITGDSSLRKRPMKRVIEPIRLMGGEIYGREENNFPPISIIGKKLKGIEYELKKPSAQVKSAIILATLNATEKSIIKEKIKTRNHTEIMLKEFGGEVEEKNNEIIVYPKIDLKGREIFVPGDFSSASYFIMLGLLLQDSEILLKDVSLNPTRIFLLNLLIQNGANIKILNERERNGEKFGDILVKSSYIKKIDVKKDEAPLMIDELPLLGAIGAFLDEGVKVEGADELRVKESDRIKVLVDNLRNLNVEAEELKDGFIVRKGKNIKKEVVKTSYDHRIALSFIVFGLISNKGVILEEVESIKISFPEFFDLLRRIENG
ncbi:MAG: 3-phosphoshikimate 1-carboxyvinyltransferase [Caldisericia bacterium]|nr:3-phosphoshikimate 1-carboxyvinyltransferase [Caldisericia bacterium]